MTFDRQAHTLRVEYDATRLNAAEVTRLVRNAGLQIVEEVVLALPAAPPEPAPLPDAADCTTAESLLI